MAGRGPQSFKKRQKEQLRKEKQQEKNAKRAERRTLGGVSPLEEFHPRIDLTLYSDEGSVCRHKSNIIDWELNLRTTSSKNGWYVR